MFGCLSTLVRDFAQLYAKNVSGGEGGGGSTICPPGFKRVDTRDTWNLMSKEQVQKLQSRNPLTELTVFMTRFFQHDPKGINSWVICQGTHFYQAPTMTLVLIQAFQFHLPASSSAYLFKRGEVEVISQKAQRALTLSLTLPQSDKQSVC